jgi:hypothetical protein
MRRFLLVLVVVTAGCGGHATAEKPTELKRGELPSPTKIRTTTSPSSSGVTYHVGGQPFVVTLPPSWTAVDTQAVLHDPAVQALERNNPNLVANIEAMRESSTNLKLLAVAGDREVTIVVTEFPRRVKSLERLRRGVLRKLHGNEPVQNGSISVRRTRVGGRPALDARFQTLAHGDEADEVFRQVVYYVPVGRRLYQVGVTMPQDKWKRFSATALRAARSFRFS